MKSWKIVQTIWRMLLALALGGTLNVVSCNNWRSYAQNFNPIGTLLTGNPYEYDWLFIDQYPNWEIDPTCTIPGACVILDVEEDEE